MNDLYQHLLATYAAVDQPMSDIAMRAIAADLECYELSAVAKALARCRKELRRITLTDIIERIDGEHPGVETSWATVSQGIGNESVSFAMTEEMAEAYGVARLLADDLVAARMSYKETYQRAVSKSRADGKRPHWFPSLGTDVSGRADAMKKAVNLNALASEAIKQIGDNGDNLPALAP